MKRKKNITVDPKCGCKKPTRHRDCAYCGTGWGDGRVCGVCREAGVDGSLILGSGRRRCRRHAGRAG